MNEPKSGVVAHSSTLLPADLDTPTRLPPSAPIDRIDGREFAKSPRLARRVFTFPAMLGGLLVAGVFVARRGFDVDPDLWWHVKVGEGILATHHFPAVDPYSFTVAGHPWMAYEWFGEILFAAVARAGGLRGLESLLIILGSAVVLALYAFCTLRSGNSKAGFVASAVLIILAAANFNLRPQMLGYLFLVLTLIALERLRQGKPRALWVLPLLFLVWVNTHGSFIIGLGTILAYWLFGLKELKAGNMTTAAWKPAEREQLSAVFLLSLIATMITPYGTKLAVYPFDMAFSQPVNVASIMEWQPMPFNLWGAKLFLALILGFFFLQIAYKFTWHIAELTLFFFGTVMACLHARFLLLFVPFFAPIFATILARWAPPYAKDEDHPILNGIILCAIVGGILWFLPTQKDIQKNVAKEFPSEAVAYLREHSVPEPMFNAYGFGGYLVWSRGPEHKVFIDGRGDIYERGGVLADYMYITNLKPGAPAVLRLYGVQSCLLARDQPLVTMLSALPEWEQVYADRLSVLFVLRKNSPKWQPSKSQAVPTSLQSSLSTSGNRL